MALTVLIWLLNYLSFSALLLATGGNGAPIASCSEQSSCLIAEISAVESSDVAQFEVCLTFDDSLDGCIKSDSVGYGCSSAQDEKVEDLQSGQSLCRTVACGEDALFGLKDGRGCTEQDDIDGLTLGSVDEISCRYADAGSYCVGGNTKECLWTIPAPQCASLTTAHPATTNPTTANPTTANPTTANPTSSAPTTRAPTTANPTTTEPTTAMPTTAEPTTVAPTTTEPTSGDCAETSECASIVSEACCNANDCSYAVDADCVANMCEADATSECATDRCASCSESATAEPSTSPTRGSRLGEGALLQEQQEENQGDLVAQDDDTEQEDETQNEDEEKTSAVGAIIAYVVAAMITLVCIMGIAFWFERRKRQRNDTYSRVALGSATDTDNDHEQQQFLA